MALIDKDKAIAEIEERRELYLGQANACIGTNIVDGLDEARTILDTLPDEYQPNLDLIKKSWYTEGYQDALYRLEPIWIIRDLKYVENPKCGKPLPDEPKVLDIPGFEGVKVHPGNMPEYEPKCLWGNEPSEESCRYCGVWCSLRKPEPNSESSTNLDSKDDAVGLSIMLYLDTHVKHENSKVCGVPLKVAREWLRRHIGKDEPKLMSFTPVLRLLNMLEPSKKAASYATKFADALEKEGYQKDANLVRNQIKIWNGEDVAMAVMDEETDEPKRSLYLCDLLVPKQPNIPPVKEPFEIPSAGSGGWSEIPPKYKLDVKPRITNKLFEECLANVDPAIRKEVSDNIDNILGRKPVEGPEKEIEKYFQGWFNDDEYGDAVTPDYTGVDVDKCKEIARNFYELGCRHTAVMYDDIEYERQRRESNERGKEPATIAFERLHGLNSKK